MDKLAETAKSGEPFNFLKYVFNFEEDNKGQIMNLFQYTILAILPVILTLKAIKHIIPEDDDSKGSLEILGECVGQLLFILAAIWISNRIITYIPTYSGLSYNNYDPISFIIPFLIILSTMQTKFGAKLNILFERCMELWRGKVNPAKNNNNNNNANNNNANNVVTVSQPVVGNHNIHQSSRADMLDTSVLGAPGQVPNIDGFNVKQQTTNDFNSMYQQNNTGMPGGAMPGMAPPQNEVVAANSCGGSGFSGWP